ncbi:MAG: TIR domain-containing protein [Candidatus Methanoperedens sp.]|nr:TIR domain-containing protein [Candidatus Methanoperedens sp.]
MANLANPLNTATSKGAVRSTTPKRSFASRWFGYDIFLSFALGPPPRGTHSYASDLARRLRERDFTVFFSEDEAPPGEQLDSTLRSALLDSKTLVVIANRDTLQDPRWVRTEVEEFRKHHPDRPVIPINIGGALQDPALATTAQEWLGYEGKIWLDEAEEAVAAGIASERVVERLATQPTRAKSNVKWRWLIRSTIALLVTLIIGLGVATKMANDSDERARAELRRAVSIRMVVDAQGMLSGVRSGGDERALLQLLAAQRIASGAETEAGMLNGLYKFLDVNKLIGFNAPVFAVAFSPDGTRIISGSGDKALRLWDDKTGEPITLPATSRSGSEDQSMRLWYAKTGQPIGVPLVGYEKKITSVAFSHDDTHIISGGEDGNGGFLLLWPAPKAWPVELCKKLTRNMSHKEWKEWVSPEIDYVVQCPGLPIPPDEPDNIKEKP